MRDRPEEDKKSHPWVEADGDGVSFGAWLRQQREMRGISIHEIATFSKISLRYLEALEASRFSVLPAPVFAKGFLRQYAGYVGLDPDEVVNYYIVAQQGEAHEDDLHTLGGSRLHSSTHWAYGLFLTVGIRLIDISRYQAHTRCAGADVSCRRMPYFNIKGISTLRQ